MAAGRIQVYETRQIRVTFDPAKCIHSGICLATLPSVFNIARRRWIDPDQASPDQVLAAVAKCPSGALQAALVTSVHPSPVANPQVEPDPRDVPGDDQQGGVKITVRDRGSLLIEGPFRVVDAGGNTLREGENCALCRCGRSRNKPFCDGSHRSVDWDSLG